MNAITYHITGSGFPSRYNPNAYSVERHTAREGWSPLVEHIADARSYEQARAIVAAFEALDSTSTTTHHIVRHHNAL